MLHPPDVFFGRGWQGPTQSPRYCNKYTKLFRQCARVSKK